MKSLLPAFLLSGSLLILAIPDAFAAQNNTAPGNYSDIQLSPTSSPPAPIGNDLVLMENVPGVTQTGPIDQNGNLVPPIVTIKAAQVTAKLDIANLDYVPPQGTLIIPPSAVIVFPTITGPTGTYAGGTIGAGKHTENTLADMKTYYSLGGTVYYQYEFDVVWYDSKNQVHSQPYVYGSVHSYFVP